MGHAILAPPRQILGKEDNQSYDDCCVPGSCSGVLVGFSCGEDRVACLDGVY